MIIINLMEFSVFDLYNNDAFVAIITSMIKSVQETTLMKLFPLFMSIGLLLAMYKYWNENGHKMGVKLEEIIRLVLLTFMLLSYVPVMSTVDKIADGLVAYFDVTVQVSTKDMLIEASIDAVKKQLDGIT